MAPVHLLSMWQKYARWGYNVSWIDVMNQAVCQCGMKMTFPVLSCDRKKINSLIPKLPLTNWQIFSKLRNQMKKNKQKKQNI